VNEAIERAAKAAYTTMVLTRSDAELVVDMMAWEDQPAKLRADWRLAVRAAIEAMREPTEAMVDAGVEAKRRLYAELEAAGQSTRTMLVANHPAGTIWEAMIDAALVGNK
jgi:hypothetical protein